MKRQFLKQSFCAVFVAVILLVLSINLLTQEVYAYQTPLRASSQTSSESSSAGIPVEPVPGPGEDDSSVPEGTSSGIVVTDYTIDRGYGPGSIAIYQNHSVRIAVSVKVFALKTGDIRRASELGITKILDSFVYNGTPQVQITSKSGEALTFQVVFEQAQYKGTGNSLKFMISYPDRLHLPADSCEVQITECKQAAEENPEDTSNSAPILQVGRNEFAAPLVADQQFTVDVTITNRSVSDHVENVTAVFEPGDGLVLMESTSSKMIPSIAPGETVTVPLNLKTASELTASSQNLGVSLKYSSQVSKNRVEGESSEKIVIPVTPNKTDPDSAENNGPDAATPNIIVSKYDYGEQVAAGETFDLTLEFQNTSKTNATENIVMSLNPAEGLSITSSSNTFFLPALGAGAIHTETIQMQALPDAKPESTKIEISFKYEFVDGDKRNQVTAGEKISIPVYQPNRFELTPPDMAVEAYVGQEANISIAYVNKGKSEISNVEAILENDQVEVMEKHQNLGNFEAGKSGSIDFIVTPMQEGEIPLTVVLQYEDSNLQLQTEEIPIVLNVMPQIIEEFYPEEPMPEQEKGVFPWIIVVTVLLAGGTALFFVLRKRRKKKAKALEEEFSWEELDDPLPKEHTPVPSENLQPEIPSEEKQEELQHEKE